MRIAGVLALLLLLSCNNPNATEAPKEPEVTPQIAIAPEDNRNWDLELIRTIVKGDREGVRELIESKRADVNVELSDADGNTITPLITAIVKYQPEIASFLLTKGAKLSTLFGGYNAKDLAIKIYGENHPLIRQIDLEIARNK